METNDAEPWTRIATHGMTNREVRASLWKVSQLDIQRVLGELRATKGCSEMDLWMKGLELYRINAENIDKILPEMMRDMAATADGDVDETNA